jgi:serine/threonine protein phosphatase 1
MRQFVIGDVHGCNVSLLALFKKIDLKIDDELYFIGDYIDRGKDSKGVFDTIFTLLDAGQKVVCLQGNHEAMLLGALSSNQQYQHMWRNQGAKQTLKSFNIFDMYDMPSNYLDFMEAMPLVVEVDDYILVHGGLDFRQSDPLNPDEQMMWLRNWYEKIDYEWLGKRIVIHGHTPQSSEKTTQQLANLERDCVLNIDCGCVLNERIHHHLACFELRSKQLYCQPNVENVWGASFYYKRWFTNALAKF